MNFLAHLFLSNKIPRVMVGNFIGDFVKGAAYANYSPEIQKGILLHRKIDSFTDAHPVFRESSSRLKVVYGRYSGVVADVVYDHFLASLWEGYSDEALHIFVSQVHRILMSHYFTLPIRVKQFLPFLIKSRRLESYQHLEGMKRALVIMSNHTILPDYTNLLLDHMSDEYETYEREFKLFFQDVLEMVHRELEEQYT